MEPVRDAWSNGTSGRGGHRVPFIIRWLGKVEPGAVTDQMMSLTDGMATWAEIVGSPLPDDAAEDSSSMLPVLIGTQGEESIREYLLQQTISPELSIRHGPWTYLDHKGFGVNDYGRPGPWARASAH